MSDYLFARPSFVDGIGRTIDLFGVLNEYNYSSNDAEADRTALANDVAVLRSDLMESYQGIFLSICDKKLRKQQTLASREHAAPGVYLIHASYQRSSILPPPLTLEQNVMLGDTYRVMWVRLRRLLYH